MTTSIAHEVEARRQQRQRARCYFADDLAQQIRADQLYATRTRFPSPLYRDRPVDFFHEVLGIEPWSKQIDVINAVRDHKRVAVASGHKIGKSNLAAGVALWFFCSFSDARVVMTSTTSRQVDQILWRELRMLRARSGRCIQCKHEDPEALRIPRPCPHSTLIEGEQGELARTGLKTPDFREVVGFTAREAEAVAGISGRHLLYVVDEASGVDDEIFTAIEGNRAGGARILLLGNPTRNEGEFFNAFYSKKHLYVSFRISSEETPNVVSGDDELIPGLATREWIEEKKQEWGEGSPLYSVRVQGKHALSEEGRIFNLHLIAQAEHRWHDMPDAGRLSIGLDPAGESGRGDETMFCPRRGLKSYRMRPFRGLTPEQHVATALHIIKELGLPREVPVIVVDREGPIGIKVYRLLLDYLDTHPHAFDVVGVRSSDGAQRQPMEYDRLRDELAANLYAWFCDGGSIVEDVKLEAELHVWEWSVTVRGKRKIQLKEKVRKELGRSPDRYDALALACWEELSLRDRLPAADAAPADNYYAEATMDPYKAMDIWRPK